MTQVDSLMFFTLNAIADDWESIVQIEPEVLECHGPVTRGEIFDVLQRLYAAGHVRAMDENGYTIDRFPAEPATAWFSMTESGRALFEETFPHYCDE